MDSDAGTVTLDSSALEDDDSALIAADRLSILDAAANARTAAMLTGTHGVVALPLDRATIKLPSPRELLDTGASFEEHEGETVATALLRARAAALASGSDAVAAMRAHLELAQAELDDGKVEDAHASAKRAAALVE